MVETEQHAAEDQPAPAPVRDIPRTIAGLSAELRPDVAAVDLLPAMADGATRIVGTRHYPADSSSNTLVLTLHSQSEEVRLVRLWVECALPGWNPRWPRWSLIPRRTPQLWGGEAVDAQDVLTENRTALTLLLLPGETREAWLRFEATLDGETPSGHFFFVVALADITDGPVSAMAFRNGTLTLNHPHSRFFQALPSIFHEAVDGERAREATGELQPFFPRFLRGFDDCWEPLQALIRALPHLFAPYETPGDFLPWLASWVGLALDDNWPEMRRRRLLAEAVPLYRWRGTRRGLTRALQIYTGFTPDITDHPFAGMRLGPNTLLGRDTLLGDVAPHTFVVTLAVPNPTAVNRQIIRAVIDSQKPAHTRYALRIVQRTVLDAERSNA